MTEVILDPSSKTQAAWCVVFQGRMTSPPFNNKGAALAYLDMITSGRRKPEYTVSGK